jgi:hypothetical protein
LNAPELSGNDVLEDDVNADEGEEEEDDEAIAALIVTSCS